MYASQRPSGENIGVLSWKGVLKKTSGFPARRPEPPFSTGTLQMSAPVAGSISTKAKRLPSGVKDHGSCEFLLSINGSG